jgi:hypothetical protein
MHMGTATHFPSPGLVSLRSQWSRKEKEATNPKLAAIVPTTTCEKRILINYSSHHEPDQSPRFVAQSLSSYVEANATLVAEGEVGLTFPR